MPDNEGPTKPLPQADYDPTFDNDPAIVKHFHDLQREDPRLRTGIPPIVPTILLAPHVSEEDAALVRNNIHNADVYVPEIFGWEQSQLDALRKISQGELSPEQAKEVTELPFGWGISKAVHNSHVPIVFVDVPREEEHRFTYKDTDTETYFQSTWEETLTSVEENMRRMVWRENYMLNQLEPQLQELIKNSPTLAEAVKQHPLRVLFSIGSDHVSFARRLTGQQQALDQQTPNAIQDDPDQYEQSYFAKALQEFEKTGQIPEDLATYVVFEKTVGRLLHYKLMRKMGDKKKAAAELKRIVDLFSPTEIKEIYENSNKQSRGKTHMTKAFMESALFGDEDEAGKPTQGLIDKKLAEQSNASTKQ